MLLRLLEVGPLDLERGGLAAVGEVDQQLETRVVADPVHRADRLGQAQLVEPHPLLDHVEDERRGAHLEQGRVLAHVRVADDHVQAAVLVGVGVRLVAGVDDAPFERGLQADLDLDVVGALRDLVARLVARGAQAHAARAAHDLPGHEEGREPRHDRRERGLAGHQVVLVGTVAGALAVDVVLVELDAGRTGTVADRSAASSITRSPALSQITTSRGW